jgi:hypothetical protein|tara:strand:+ start:341 stop:682 length:342 start_codon:yes stop_codon:yes gene_type:complete
MSYSVSAQQAKTIARNDLIIFDETSVLMRQVIVDAGTGLYQTTITDNTTMTESTPSPTVVAQAYFNVWQGTVTDAVKTDQMKEVIKYFENLGYAIDRQTNTSTNSTFKWVISY